MSDLEADWLLLAKNRSQTKIYTGSTKLDIKKCARPHEPRFPQGRVRLRLVVEDNCDAVKPEICTMDVQMTNIQQGPKSSDICRLLMMNAVLKANKSPARYN